MEQPTRLVIESILHEELQSWTKTKIDYSKPLNQKKGLEEEDIDYSIAYTILRLEKEYDVKVRELNFDLFKYYHANFVSFYLKNLLYHFGWVKNKPEVLKPLFAVDLVDLIVFSLES